MNGPSPQNIELAESVFKASLNFRVARWSKLMETNISRTRNRRLKVSWDTRGPNCWDSRWRPSCQSDSEPHTPITEEAIAPTQAAAGKGMGLELYGKRKDCAD